METSRRNLLSLLPLAGASSLLLSASANLESLAQQATEETADSASYNFWTQQVRDPEAAAEGRTRGLGPSPPRASFLYYDEHNGFVTGSDIGDDGLKDTGDLEVLVNVDHVRPSVADQARFVSMEGGSLRIDLQQGMPLPGLAERLAWTSIAGFLPENKTLPALKEMTFDPGTTWGKLQTVPLPGGLGRWTWNFFLQRRKSRWMQIFDVIRRTQGLITPIFGLGFPAIATTALATVDALVGQITRDERTEWLLQSPDVTFYGTKRARDSYEGTKLRLKKGMYVIMPSDKLSAFAKQQKDLTVKDGLIVPKNTASLEVEGAAKETIKDITYLTVGVTARTGNGKKLVFMVVYIGPRMGQPPESKFASIRKFSFFLAACRIVGLAFVCGGNLACSAVRPWQPHSFFETYSFQGERFQQCRSLPPNCAPA